MSQAASDKNYEVIGGEVCCCDLRNPKWRLSHREKPSSAPGNNNWYWNGGFWIVNTGNASNGFYSNCADTTQPGVAAIMTHLNALPKVYASDGKFMRQKVYASDEKVYASKSLRVRRDWYFEISGQTEPSPTSRDAIIGPFRPVGIS